MASILVTPTRSNVERNRHIATLRKRREAIEEMRRNGVIISPDWAHEVDNPRPELPALNVHDIGLEDFVSAPDAEPMAQPDSCNVESVTVDELQAVLTDVAKRLGRTNCRNAYREWEAGKPGWRDDDVRWTLTPHALRRLEQFA